MACGFSLQERRIEAQFDPFVCRLNLPKRDRPARRIVLKSAWSMNRRARLSRSPATLTARLRGATMPLE